MAGEPGNITEHRFNSRADILDYLKPEAQAGTRPGKSANITITKTVTATQEQEHGKHNKETHTQSNTNVLTLEL